jgi:predicted MFS family arabinose efflux permease
LAGFASTFAQRAVEPMLPLLAVSLEVTLQQAALLVSAYSIPYAVMQLVLGPVGDAIGKTRLIRLSIVIFFAGMALAAMAPGYGSLLAARAISGGFAGGLIPVAMALIGDRVSYDGRQVAISRFLLATISGQMIGAALAGLLADFSGWRTVFVVFAAVTAACGLPVVLFLKDQDEKRSVPTLRGAIANYRAVLRNPVARIVYGTVFCEGMFIMGVFSFVVPMLVRHGATGAAEGGIVIAGFAVGGIVYSLVARRLLAVLGQAGMMRTGALIVSVVYIATAIPSPWPAEIGLFLIAGFGFFTLHNTMQTLATELSLTARGSAMAMFAALLFLGTGTGPIVAGVVVEHVGVELLFVGAGGMIAVFGFCSAALISRTKS